MKSSLASFSMLMFVALLLPESRANNGLEKITESASDSAKRVNVKKLMPIEHALLTGRRCLRQKKVQISRQFIYSVQLKHATPADKNTHWLLTWAHIETLSGNVKGGQVYVSVFQDETCKIQYGE
jgi:hypothetical protein